MATVEFTEGFLVSWMNRLDKLLRSVASKDVLKILETIRTEECSEVLFSTLYTLN